MTALVCFKDKLFYVSHPQFPYLQNGKKKNQCYLPHQIIVRIKTVYVIHIHYTLHTAYITHNAGLRADFSLLYTFYFY